MKYKDNYAPEKSFNPYASIIENGDLVQLKSEALNKRTSKNIHIITNNCLNLLKRTVLENLSETKLINTSLEKNQSIFIWNRNRS